MNTLLRLVSLLLLFATQLLDNACGNSWLGKLAVLSLFLASVALFLAALETPTKKDTP